MTQDKIERWHQTMKSRILTENYFLPGDLEAKVGRFVDHYNHCRYRESIGNLVPADVYTGRGQAILERREAISAESSNTAAGCTGRRPPKLQVQMRRNLR